MRKRKSESLARRGGLGMTLGVGVGREKLSSVLHGMGSGGEGEVAFGDFRRAASEDGAECVGRMAGEESLQRLGGIALGVEEIE